MERKDVGTYLGYLFLNLKIQYSFPITSNTTKKIYI